MSPPGDLQPKHVAAPIFFGIDGYYLRTLVCILFVTAAGILLMIAAFSYFRNSAFVRRASYVQGKVVQLEERRGEGGSYFRAIFEFRDAAGAVYTVRDSVGSYPASYAVGDSVSVLFEPTDPKKAKLDSFNSLWGMSFVMGILGGVSLFFALIIYAITEFCIRRHSSRLANPTKSNAALASQ